MLQKFSHNVLTGKATANCIVGSQTLEWKLGIWPADSKTMKNIQSMLRTRAVRIVIERLHCAIIPFIPLVTKNKVSEPAHSKATIYPLIHSIHLLSSHRDDEILHKDRRFLICNNTAVNLTAPAYSFNKSKFHTKILLPGAK